MSVNFRINFAKERKEYADIKKCNKTFKFDSIESYMNTKETNNRFIQNPREYFGHLWTTLYDFLQVDTSMFIQYKHDWIKFYNENNVKSLDDYNLCALYNKVQKNSSEFYIGCLDICVELDFLLEIEHIQNSYFLNIYLINLLNKYFKVVRIYCLYLYCI